ncbi:hypothetical protein [Streptomyces sanglieri]|uniref:hypothetical protein n=1 Tax=Streptomyces sanglieri TaxID=193460 RepID=UPI0035243BBC
MRSRAISVMVAAVATAAALAQPARAAPLIDGVYRFAALKDGQCLVWPKLNGSTGMVSLGACTDNSATSANWRVRQRPNGTMEVSTPGSNPSTCLMVTTGHRVMISDNCADKYAEWTVSYGSAGPGSVVWADIEHTPGDHSGSWGKLLDTPDVIGRLVVKQTPVEPHYWALQQVGWEPRQRGQSAARAESHADAG